MCVAKKEVTRIRALSGRHVCLKGMTAGWKETIHQPKIPIRRHLVLFFEKNNTQGNKLRPIAYFSGKELRMKHLLFLTALLLPAMSRAQTALPAEQLLYEVGSRAPLLQQNEVAQILGPANQESVNAGKRIWIYGNDSLQWRFLFSGEQKMEAFEGVLMRPSATWLPLEKVRQAQLLHKASEIAALLGKPQRMQYQSGESIWQYLIQGGEAGQMMRIWLRFDAQGQLQPNGFAFEMRKEPAQEKLSERKLKRVKSGSSTAEVQRALGLPATLTINGKQEQWNYWASNMRVQIQFDESGKLSKYYYQAIGQ